MSFDPLLNSGMNMWESRKTMNFFPANDVSSMEHSRSLDSFSPANHSVGAGEAQAAQMTMFYGGQVIVFNNFPADKAREIMLLASQASLSSRIQTQTTSINPSETSSLTLPVPCSLINHLSIASGLPLARRASLHRFLAKRKDRIASNAPYQATSKPNMAGKPWLALS